MNFRFKKQKRSKGTAAIFMTANGVLLAYNELAYSVTIQDNGDYDKKSEKIKL